MFSVGRGKNSRSSRRRKDRVRVSDSLERLSPDEDIFTGDINFIGELFFLLFFYVFFFCLFWIFCFCISEKRRITFRTGERPICLGETCPDVYSDCNKYNAISVNAGEGGDWIEILVNFLFFWSFLYS